MSTSRRTLKAYPVKISSALLACLALFTFQVGAVTKNVDCDKGQTIQSIIDKKQQSSEPLTINVNGICEEYVSISRDDVSIYGNNDATVEGTIEVLGGMRILVDSMKLKGPGIGLHVFGGSAELRNSYVTNNGDFGIAVNRNSFLSVYDSTISTNAHDGLHVIVGSTVELHNTDILNNTGNGIEIDRHSNADIRDGCKISGNDNGVRMYLHSSAFITDTEITNNHSNGIWMNNDSGVIGFAPITISGNSSYGVFCYDAESSFETNSAISDTINCSDFNY